MRTLFTISDMSVHLRIYVRTFIFTSVHNYMDLIASATLPPTTFPEWMFLHLCVCVLYFLLSFETIYFLRLFYLFDFFSLFYLMIPKNNGKLFSGSPFNIKLLEDQKCAQGWGGGLRSGALSVASAADKNITRTFNRAKL